MMLRIRSDVVPYVGTWIEIAGTATGTTKATVVVPYVGTWIEIYHL